MPQWVSFSLEKLLSRVPLNILPQVTILSELYFAARLDCLEVSELHTQKQESRKLSGQRGPWA